MRNKKNAATGESGMSLVEVIITMFMISVLLVLYVAALNTVAQTKKLRFENLAYHIASKQMEELRNVAQASLPASGTITDPMLSQLPTGSADYAVSDYPGFSGMKEISIIVRWNDGIAKQFNLKSLAGTGGINP